MIERLRRWALPALTIASLIAAGVALDLTGALPLYRAAIHRTPSLLPSTIVMAPEEVARGVSTVSLYVPPEELQGEGIGILRYRLRRGPSWERFGWISFFENGGWSSAAAPASGCTEAAAGGRRARRASGCSSDGDMVSNDFRQASPSTASTITPLSASSCTTTHGPG